mmetsp:Transcript_12959/g.30929  ORF Transcript_12959/g.30929 Transcript_12959/m.30929 type:complete len:662 (+) Transcript_12959:973-2958(+)
MHLDEGVHEVCHGDGLGGGDGDGIDGCVGVVLDLLDQIAPLLQLRLVDIVVEYSSLGWEFDDFPFVPPPVAEALAVVDAILLGQAPAARPHHAEHKPVLQRLRGWTQQRLQHVAERHHHGNVDKRHLDLAAAPHVLERLGPVLLKQLRELRLGLLGPLLPLQPAGDVRPPLCALGVADVDDAGTGDGGGGGEVEVADLEDHPHVGLQGDALVGGEGEDLVVVHHTVHRLDPIRIQITIEDDPLGVGVRDGPQRPHRLGEQPILPLARGHVDAPIQFVRRDRLGVDVHPSRLLARVVLALAQHLPHRRLARPGSPHDKDAVADLQQLLQLDDLKDEVRLWVEARLDTRLLHDGLELHVSLPGRVDARKEIRQEAGEDDQIVCDDLGDVGIAQRPHQQGLLRKVGLRTFEGAGHHQHGLDGSETPIVVLCLREQVPAEGIEAGELARQRLGLDEALSHEHVLANELHIGHHHSDWSEERLETLGQLRATQVAGVHGDECSTCGVEGNLITLQHEPLGLGLDGVDDGLELHRAHRQHLGHQTIELIEAAPRTRRRQALEDVAHGLVVHLVGAVEHIHSLAHRRRQILGGLCFAGSCGPCGCASHTQVESLCGRHVDAIREWRDDQPRPVAEVLVAVPEGSISNRDAHVVLTCVPVEFELALPLE